MYNAWNEYEYDNGPPLIVTGSVSLRLGWQWKTTLWPLFSRMPFILHKCKKELIMFTLIVCDLANLFITCSYLQIYSSGWDRRGEGPVWCQSATVYGLCCREKTQDWGCPRNPDLVINGSGEPCVSADWWVIKLIDITRNSIVSPPVVPIIWGITWDCSSDWASRQAKDRVKERTREISKNCLMWAVKTKNALLSEKRLFNIAGTKKSSIQFS